MKYKKASKEKFDKNPFLKSLVSVELSKKNIVATSNDFHLIDKDGENHGAATFLKVVQYDKEKFIKFYVANLTIFFELSKRSLKILSYIMNIIKPNTDRVYISIRECSEFTGYKSKATVISGLSELTEKKIIAPSVDAYLWYINPTVFFNGDRVNFIKSAVLEGSDEANKLMSQQGKLLSREN